MYARRAIKVIKRKQINSGKKRMPTIPNVDLGEHSMRRRRIRTVNDWISERRKNRILEKDFSDAVIASWENGSVAKTSA